MSPQTSIAARPSKPAQRSILSAIRPPKLLSFRKEPRTGLGVPLPSSPEGGSNGTFYQRHQNHGGFAASWPSGHLLRRAADYQIAPKDDRESHKSRPRRGLEGPPRRNQQAGRTASESLRKARQGPQWDQLSGHRRYHQGGRRDG